MATGHSRVQPRDLSSALPGKGVTVDPSATSYSVRRVGQAAWTSFLSQRSAAAFLGIGATSLRRLVQGKTTTLANRFEARCVNAGRLDDGAASKSASHDTESCSPRIQNEAVRKAPTSPQSPPMKRARPSTSSPEQLSQDGRVFHVFLLLLDHNSSSRRVGRTRPRRLAATRSEMRCADPHDNQASSQRQDEYM